MHVPVNYFINSENNFLGLYLIIRFELFQSQCHVNSVTVFLRFKYGLYSIYYFYYYKCEGITTIGKKNETTLNKYS